MGQETSKNEESDLCESLKSLIDNEIQSLSLNDSDDNEKHLVFGYMKQFKYYIQNKKKPKVVFDFMCINQYEILLHSDIRFYELNDECFNYICLLILLYYHSNKENKDKSIIIIGTGYAGIHMALLLIESGYKNIKILERKHKIRGKTLTIKDKKLNIVHELGPCYIDNNNEELIKLINRFDIDNKLIQIDENMECGIIDNDHDNNECVGCKDWMKIKTEKISKPQILEWFSSEQRNIDIDTDINKIYKKLYQSIFGIDYANNNDIDIPPKPDINKMELINMSFLEFLIKNGLQALIPQFVYKMSCKGYGNLNDIPAFYGLWYNKPNMLLSHDNYNGLYILEKGIYSLFKSIVEINNINIIYNVELKSIDRHIDDIARKIEIKYLYKDNKNDNKSNKEDKIELIECDILFIACDMNQIRTENEEKEIYDNMNTFTLCCTLFQCDIDNMDINKDKGIQIWPQKLLKYDSHLYSIRNSSKLLLKNNYYKLCKEKKLKKEKLIGYQFSNKLSKNGSGKIFKEILLNDLNDLNKKNIQILKQKIIRYFPKFNQYGINKGYPWKIWNELQGKLKNTYYIGTSTCFHSIESELRYNIKLKNKLNL